MKNADELRNFLADYERYVTHILKPTNDEIKAHLQAWLEPDYWTRHTKKSGTANPSPIRMTLTRIKRPEQVVDKILRRPATFPDGLSPASFRKMQDTIGVRVLVYFLSQLPLVDRDLRKSRIIEISEEYPPEVYLTEDLRRRFGLAHIERKEKESGYASIHYTARLRKSSLPEADRPWFEIQIRTLAQELWSEMEHILAYKAEIRSYFSAKRRFQILSTEISALDEHFNLLYEELVQNQESVRYRDGDDLDVENLPAALEEIGVRCAQRDINTILKLLHSRGINTVGDLLKIAAPRRLETIRNTYMSSVGRPPGTFELLATLGALKGIKKGESEIKRINAHIEYRKTWDIFRKELQ